MKDNYPIVTIGFVAREKFSSAGRCLAALYKFADIPFRLIIIDCGIPNRYLDEMKVVLKRHDNYEIISHDGFLNANAQKQLVIDRVKDGYVLLVENDTLISRGFLSNLLDACIEYQGKCVVVPEIFERFRLRRRVHHDSSLGEIETIENNGMLQRIITPDPSVYNRHLKQKVRRVIRTTDNHVFMLHKDVIDEIGGLDTRINTRELYDLSLQLYESKIPIVLEPNVEADFIQAPPIRKDERAFYRFSWDSEMGRESNRYLAEKWNVPGFPESTNYVESQHYRTSRFRWFFHRADRKLHRTVEAFRRLLT